MLQSLKLSQRYLNEEFIFNQTKPRKKKEKRIIIYYLPSIEKEKKIQTEFEIEKNICAILSYNMVLQLIRNFLHSKIELFFAANTISYL